MISPTFSNVTQISVILAQYGIVFGKIIPQKLEAHISPKMFTGIIAEFNPLHKGHESLIKFAKSRQDSEGLVVILSSNFTQRGSPSIVNKFTRSWLTIKSGADLVVELPFIYACSAGENFADGAVEILGRLGCVSRLVFGMEDSDFDLHGLAEAVVSEAFTEALRLEMKSGASYSKAFALSAEKIFAGSLDFLSKPNNTLALSYVLSVKRKGFNIEAVPVKRQGSVNSKMIRANLNEAAEFLPSYSLEALKTERISDESKLWSLLQCVLNRSSSEDLRKIYGVDEGIEGLFLKHWRTSSGLDDFIGHCVCARYTRAHIRRLVVYILLGLERDETLEALKNGVPYARVLAFNEHGREILRRLKKNSGIPIITSLKFAKSPAGKFFAQTEFKASSLYEMTMNEPDMSRENQKVLQFSE